MGEIIQSAWWIVYYLDQEGEPRYLLIKRLAISKKIERVAPKWKLQQWESMQSAALREVSEEAGIPIDQLKLKQELWTTQLRNTENIRWQMDKDVTYFLMQFGGNPSMLDITEKEGYIGVYKWASLSDVLGLIYYNDIRELIRKSYILIKQDQKNSNIKQEFLQKLDL